MAEQKFFFESYQDTGTIKTYLESLITGIGKKRIMLATEEEEIILRPHGLLRLTVKAKKKGDKNRLSIKMSWSDLKHCQNAQDHTMLINT